MDIVKTMQIDKNSYFGPLRALRWLAYLGIFLGALVPIIIFIFPPEKPLGPLEKAVLGGVGLSMLVVALILLRTAEKKLERSCMLLEAVLTPELAEQALRKQARLAFMAFRDQSAVLHTHGQDRDVSGYEIRARNAKKAFWTLHSSFASLGIPLEKKISDYA